MITKSTIEKVMYLITFAGILTANISSILFGVHVMHPAFLAGVLIAVIGVNGVLLLKHPSFQIHHISENSNWIHYVD